MTTTAWLVSSLKAFCKCGPYGKNVLRGGDMPAVRESPKQKILIFCSTVEVVAYGVECPCRIGLEARRLNSTIMAVKANRTHRNTSRSLMVIGCRMSNVGCRCCGGGRSLSSAFLSAVIVIAIVICKAVN